MRTYIARRCAKMVARAITKMATKAGVRVFAGVAVGVLLLGCGGAKNTAYVKDSSDYTLQNNSADKKLQALRERCKADDVDACRTLIDKGDIQGLQKLCDSQVGHACWSAGDYYEMKNKDSQQSILWYKKGCDIDNLYSCISYYYNIKDYAETLKFSLKGCESGDMEVCSALGHLYREGEGVKQNGAKALELYIKACGGKDKFGCYNAGVMYHGGYAGVKNDFVKARSYYHKACELGAAEGCSNLGVMYEYGNGGKRNDAKALELYEKACDLGYGGGCANVGIWYEDKQQYGKARKLYEKGCKLNSGEACYNLAVLYYNGKGARQDYKQAKELCGKACDLDNQEGCEGYKELKDAGY